MRALVLVGVTSILLAGCGQSSASDRVDALNEQGGPFTHDTLPSPSRKAELGQAPAPGEVSPRTVASRLRQHEEGRALLDAGAAVVPELIPLLEDGSRRTLAAVLLAEIGGEDAAAALLAQWRGERARRVKKRSYRRLGAGEPPRYLAGGHRYEGVDSDFYGEVLHALAFCGRPVSSEIAADTRAAMDESERRKAAGEAISEEVEEDGVRLAWNVASVETADEGLEVLIMNGAPEAVTLAIRALASPVGSFRYTAVQSATFLGRDAEKTLPALAALLDDSTDPTLRRLALAEIHLILGLPEHPSHDVPADSLPEGEMDARVERVKETLRDRGYLDR